MLIQAFSTVPPALYEPVFLLDVIDVGPAVFALKDVPTVNPLITAAIAGEPPDVIDVRCHAIGVYTGFHQVINGLPYWDVFTPKTADEVMPVRICPGQPGGIGEGVFVTIGAALAAPFTQAGLVYANFTDDAAPPAFIGLVPTAAQLFQVVAVRDEDTVDVVSLTLPLGSGHRHVFKAQNVAIPDASNSPIGLYPSTDSGAAVMQAYAWPGALPVDAVPAGPVGAPVVGGTLLAFMSLIGPAIDNTLAIQALDAQVEGLAHLPVAEAFPSPGTYLAAALSGDVPGAILQANPAGGGVENSPIAVVGSMLNYTNIGHSVAVVQLQPNLSGLGVVYPTPGP